MNPLATIGLVIFCLATFCPTARGQTNTSLAPLTLNPQPSTNSILTTNLVTAPSHFRVVNGQLYNIQRSKLWQEFTGEVQARRNGVIIVWTYQIKSRARYAASTGNAGLGLGGGGGLAIPPATIKWKEYGRTLAITNAEHYATLAEGNEVDLWVMRAGVLDEDGRTLELWDRGTVNQAVVITTNKPAALKPTD